jgi:hypothetical protein
MFTRCKPKPPRRLLLLCILCVLCGAITGCDSTPQSRLETAKYVVEQGQKQSQSLDALITELEHSIANWKGILAIPDLPAGERDKLLPLLTAAETKLTSTKEIKAKIDDAVTKSKDIFERALAGQDMAEEEWQAYAQLIQMVGLTIGGKWGIYGMLAASLIGFAISILKQIKTKKEARKVVESVDVLLGSKAVINEKMVIDGKEVVIEKPVINKDEAKKILAAEQDTSTVNFVHELKKV